MGCLMLLKQLSKISYPLALISLMGAVILGWIGFSVPDWLSFQQVLTNENKFGLWVYCKHSISIDANGYSCVNWSNTSVKIPDFLRTVQGLITIGMIFVTFTMVIAVLPIFVKKEIFIIAATLSSFISLLFILVGIIVFAGDYSEYVDGLSGTNAWRRWGYWIFSAVIILLIGCTVLLPYKYLFIRFINPRLEHKLKTKSPMKYTTNAASGISNGVHLVPSRSNPGYFREARAPSPVNISYHPSIYETSRRAPDVKRSKEPKAIIREIIEPVFYNDLPANNDKTLGFDEIHEPYEFKDKTIILPGELNKVRYIKDLKKEEDENKKWDWEKVRKQ